MACTPKVAEEMLSKVYQSLSARRGEAFTRMTPEAVEVEAAEAVQEAMRVAIFMQAAGEAVVVAVAEVPDLEAVGMRAADTEEDDYGSLEISSLQSIRCRTRSLSNDFTKFSAFPTRTHDMTYDGYDLDHSSEVAEDKSVYAKRCISLCSMKGWLVSWDITECIWRIILNGLRTRTLFLCFSIAIGCSGIGFKGLAYNDLNDNQRSLSTKLDGEFIIYPHRKSGSFSCSAKVTKIIGV